VFYEMLTGKRPFRGSTTILTIHAILTGEFTPAHALNPEVPRSLSDTISRLLSRDPDARYPNAETLLDALHEVNSEWMTNSAVRSSSREASVPAAPQKRGPVFMAVAAFAATAVVALLILAWNVFSRPDPGMHDAELAVPSDKSQQENPVIPAGTVGERDLDQHKDLDQHNDLDQYKMSDVGNPIYQDVVRGLVIEPDGYRDGRNPDREDPRAAMFVDDLKLQLALKLRSEVRVIPVSRQRWQQSIDAVNAKKDPSERAKIGENLPELGANILLAVWGRFLPDQKLYVFHLLQFNSKGSSFFQRGFVFKEQELLENPDVCRDTITSTQILYPKQPIPDPIDSHRVTGVVIEPIFFSCNDPDRFRVVTDTVRENLQQQIRERSKSDVAIVSATLESWQLTRAKNQSLADRLLDYAANFHVSVEGRFDESSQSDVVELNVTNDSRRVEFSRRFVYAPGELAGNPTAFQEDILNTTLFSSSAVGDVLYPEFVTGLIVEPNAYVDQFDSPREDPAASEFVGRLQFQLAQHLGEYVPVNSVTLQAWEESVRVTKKKLQEKDRYILGMNVPELGANLLLSITGEFRPLQREYIFDLTLFTTLFTARPRRIFGRRFVFGEQQLLDDPVGCRNQILATPIFHPKQAESPTVDPDQFRAVAIAPILYTAEPFSQFGFVSPQDRQRMQTQLAEALQRQVKVISTSYDEWERSLAAHSDGPVGANVKAFAADAALEVSGFYQYESQSYVLRVSLMNHLGASLFERRFVYDEQTFQGDLETIWMKILATRIFQKPDPQSRDEN